MKNKKAAIVVGHTENSQGACSPHGISCEWETMFGIATELVMRDKGEMYLYDYDDGYTTMVKKNASQVNSGNHGLILEFHYNAATPAAEGSEALYYHDAHEDYSEVKIAKFFCDEMEELGFSNRGPKPLSSARDRGYAATYYPKGDCIILEFFFGTNNDDVQRFKDKYWEIIDITEDIIDKHNNGDF